MRYLSTLLIIALSSVFVQAQVCQGDVVLTSQEEVNAFNCEVVNGTLLITGPDIVSLEPLWMLKRVDEHVILQSLPALESLRGLQNLTDVTCSFEIKDVEKITSLDGLDQLDSIGRNLTVINNDALTSLAGLNEDITYALRLQVWENPLLMACCEITGLARSVTGTVAIYNNGANCDLEAVLNCGTPSIVCKGNVSISSQEDADRFNCEVIEGDLSIGNRLDPDNNANLNTINLSKLKRVTGSVFITGDATMLKGLSNLNSIGGELFLVSGYYKDPESNYIHLDSLRSLKSLGGIRVINFSIQGELNAITDPMSVVEAAYDARILTPTFLGTTPSVRQMTIGMENYQWESKFMLSKLKKNGDLYVWYFNRSFDGMQHLDSLSHFELTFSNPYSFDGLENLKFASDFILYSVQLPQDQCILYPLVNNRDGSSRFIWENSSLTLEQFLEACSVNTNCAENILVEYQYQADEFDCPVVAGDLRIYDNRNLDLQNFKVLQEVGGSLEIGIGWYSDDSNNNPDYLRAFENLNSVGQKLSLDGGTFYLTGMSGLRQVDNLEFSNGEYYGGLQLSSNTLNEMNLRGGILYDTDWLSVLENIKTLRIFRTNYPPDAYFPLLGNGSSLEIEEEYYQVIDLSGLSHVSELDLLRLRFVHLKSFDGLENLESVKELRIENTDIEESCCGLYNLLQYGTVDEVVWDYVSCSIEEILDGCATPDQLVAMNLYPNPVTSDDIKLDWDGEKGQEAFIQIIDNFGKEVYRVNAESNHGMNYMSVPINGLKPGYYLIRIHTGDQIQLKRFIRQ